MPRSPSLIAPAIGWPLLPQPDENGRIDWPTLEASVSGQLKVILATRPGELLGHPDYGAGLQEFLHEPNTLATRARIQARIEDAIRRLEPRVVLDAIEVFDDTDAAAAELGRVRIEIHYRLRRTGVARTTGLTLALAGA
jgi:phage baseplate assembly protein W